MAANQQENKFSIVDIRNLHKHFGQNHVLNGVDLQIARGEIVSIIGQSGSGKSTLLRCINGLESYQSGELRVESELVDCSNKRALQQLRSNVGMIFQNFNLFPHLTVAENIMLAPRLTNYLTKEKAQEQALRLLQRVSLADKFDEYPDQLSGGQKQRVAIARALAINPEILLCDEITSALDPQLVNEVLLVIEALAKEGMTIIMVTHEMAFARKISDKVVFMYSGKVHEMGSRKCYLIIHRRLNSSASCRWYCNFWRGQKTLLQMAVFSLSLIRIASA
ncbi:glutamate transport ATP-binding protein [Klebsiella michiganensis]|uniref:Glutamate transport ATP-binding protein n=1 Tax=Klebsiella michiganensis TaxID=1134687 RepID=A0A7H4MSU7_9ENTR|nr:glutamate transport ATP-binding protein [Klebsiella michiganensis]